MPILFEFIKYSFVVECTNMAVENIYFSKDLHVEEWTVFTIAQLMIEAKLTPIYVVGNFGILMTN